MLWIKVYGLGSSPFSSSLLHSVLLAIQDHFAISGALGASEGDRWRSIPDILTWVDKSAKEQLAGDEHHPGVVRGFGCGDRSRSWFMHSHCDVQDAIFECPETVDTRSWLNALQVSNVCERTPILLIGLDLALERHRGAASAFIGQLCSILLHNDEWWYGFVHVCDSNDGPALPFYLHNSLDNPSNWDLLAEQEWWAHFGLARRSVVRNLYWGNFLGTQMRDAMDKAGSITFMQEAIRGNYGPWPQITIGDYGMFVRLSEDPVWHEQHKHELTSGPDPTGRAAAILKEALSRASLL